VTQGDLIISTVGGNSFSKPRRTRNGLWKVRSQSRG
jgi:hypothetical protein